jgi:methyltransferase-like protein/2-polyprenyl-3-methyl-5-hydroxy-6-metoxy-1,4-benzoquinol methylase
LSYQHSHPNRLATVATLLGLEPAPVERCRVLELGCASGGNLIPLACGLPESTFTGLDASVRQIEEGRATLQALSLPNIRLECVDILDVTPALGQFDYIIAHGVYSWVPAAVRDRLLHICKQNLAPHGIAYVSYNTYPGWHMLGVVREMMLFHTRGLDDPHERVHRARELLERLCQTTPGESDVYDRFVYDCAQFLQSNLGGSRSVSDAFLLHNELEAINEPICFYQFAEHAARHGLQYLGEANYSDMAASLPASEVLRRFNARPSSVVDREQYTDFSRNRMFRRTLLCHEGRRVSRTLIPARLENLYVSARAEPAEVERRPPSLQVASYRGPDGTTLSTGHPVTKAALRYLAQRWPETVPFGELLAAARALLNDVGRARHKQGPGAAKTTHEDVAADARVLAADLLEAYVRSTALVELHVYAPHMVLEAGEYPTASPVARLQAQRSDQVTNLRHERVQLDGAHRHLLTYLDGKHDRAAIIERLAAGPVANGTLIFRAQDQPVRDPRRVRALLAEGLEVRLDGLASMALLIA